MFTFNKCADTVTGVLKGLCHHGAYNLIVIEIITEVAMQLQL